MLPMSLNTRARTQTHSKIKRVMSHRYEYMSPHIRQYFAFQMLPMSLNTRARTQTYSHTKITNESCHDSSKAHFRPFMSHLHFTNSMSGALHCTNLQKRSGAHFRPSMSHLLFTNSMSGAPHRMNSQKRSKAQRTLSWHVVQCCNVLHWVAVRCSALQCIAVRGSVKQCDAVRCSAMQCDAVRCSAMQCIAVRCSAMQCDAVWCGALQCVAVCCSALQFVAQYCNVVQRVAALEENLGSNTATTKMVLQQWKSTNFADLQEFENNGLFLCWLAFLGKSSASPDSYLRLHKRIDVTSNKQSKVTVKSQ